MHQFSAAKYRDGALNLTRHGINMIEGKYQGGKKSFHRKDDHVAKGPNLHKKSYEQIQSERTHNPEFMTGKKFQKKKGNVGKKFKTGKSKSKGKRK